METDIIKKITPKKIIEVFENTDVINIRSYQPTNGQIVNDNNFDVPINYKVRIRHNEDENPKELLNNAIKLL
jgi:hypothetical protein